MLWYDYFCKEFAAVVGLCKCCDSCAQDTLAPNALQPARSPSDPPPPPQPLKSKCSEHCTNPCQGEYKLCGVRGIPVPGE